MAILGKNLNADIARVCLVALVGVFCLWASCGDCMVGQSSQNGYPMKVENFAYDKFWTNNQVGCFVGHAGNLVVDPHQTLEANGAQVLETTGTGSALCRWLDNMYSLHHSREERWKVAHKQRRSQISWYNFFRRIRERYRGFPIFQIRVRIDYLDLWHNDNFGNAMPWVRTAFHYVCPDGYAGSGAFDDLCNAVFTEDFARGITSTNRTEKIVYLLLAPSSTYNQPVTFNNARKRQYFYGLLKGLSAPSEGSTGQKMGKFDIPLMLYTASSAIATIQGKPSDFWVSDGACYFTSRLQAQWGFLNESICDVVERIEGGDMLTAIASQVLSSITVYVIRLDILSYQAPILYAHVTESLLTSKLNGDFTISFAIDNNPQNPADMRTSRNVTAATRVAKATWNMVTATTTGPPYPPAPSAPYPPAPSAPYPTAPSAPYPPAPPAGFRPEYTGGSIPPYPTDQFPGAIKMPEPYN